MHWNVVQGEDANAVEGVVIEYSSQTSNGKTCVLRWTGEVTLKDRWLRKYIR